MPLTWFKEIDSMGKKRRLSNKSPVAHKAATWCPEHAARLLNQLIIAITRRHHTWQHHTLWDEDDDAAFFSLSSELRHYSGKHPDWELFYRIDIKRDLMYRKLHTCPLRAFSAVRPRPTSTRRILSLKPQSALHLRPEKLFSWPSTVISASHAGLPESKWPKVGIFQSVGYRVGEKRLYRNQRLKLLQWVFEQELPLVEDQAYMAEWGNPAEPKRLEKMAKTIAAFIRSAKRRQSANMRQAIADWEADLAWLKQHYYVGMSWQWPAT